jgi:hypothetical protein
MSHFTVMVIGDNVDEQMAPYHEFECTGDDNEYVQDTTASCNGPRMTTATARAIAV